RGRIRRGCGRGRRTASRRGRGRCPARGLPGQGRLVPARRGSRRGLGGGRRGWWSSGGSCWRSGLGSRACEPTPTGGGRGTGGRAPCRLRLGGGCGRGRRGGRVRRVRRDGGGGGRWSRGAWGR